MPVRGRVDRQHHVEAGVQLVDRGQPVEAGQVRPRVVPGRGRRRDPARDRHVDGEQAELDPRRGPGRRARPAGQPATAPGIDPARQHPQRVQQGLRPRRAARHVDVDRDELVDPLGHAVGVPVRSAAVGAGTERDHVLRLGQLGVQPRDRRGHRVGQRAGDDEHVRRVVLDRLGRGPQRRRDHLDRAAGQPDVEHPEGEPSGREPRGHGPRVVGTVSERGGRTASGRVANHIWWLWEEVDPQVVAVRTRVRVPRTQRQGGTKAMLSDREQQELQRIEEALKAERQALRSGLAPRSSDRQDPAVAGPLATRLRHLSDRHRRPHQRRATDSRGDPVHRDRDRLDPLASHTRGTRQRRRPSGTPRRPARRTHPRLRPARLIRPRRPADRRGSATRPRNRMRLTCRAPLPRSRFRKMVDGVPFRGGALGRQHTSCRKRSSTSTAWSSGSPATPATACSSPATGSPRRPRRFGNDISTLPNFPAEIRAPAGTLPGVSSFQVHFADYDILTPGDAPNVLVAMNPAALKANLADLPARRRHHRQHRRVHQPQPGQGRLRRPTRSRTARSTATTCTRCR